VAIGVEQFVKNGGQVGGFFIKIKMINKVLDVGCVLKSNMIRKQFFDDKLVQVIAIDGLSR
jgi:hypothetical protein